MLFKKCRFKEKSLVKKEVKEEIMLFLKQELPFEKYNEGLTYMYIDFLLNETEYDVRNNQFYYKHKGLKIDLTIKLLQNIAYSYIMEHPNDFLLDKHQ